jgi:hypothetical protein
MSPADAVAKKKLRIEYKNYEQQMMLKEGVMLVGRQRFLTLPSSRFCELTSLQITPPG